MSAYFLKNSKTFIRTIQSNESITKRKIFEKLVEERKSQRS
jgi:hypothetical protein